jgi:hypothetical protein
VSFSVSAHSDPANIAGNAKGSITQVRPAACGEPAGYKARVVCLDISGDEARLAANYLASHGAFTPLGHVVALFVDNGNPGPDGPVDFVFFENNLPGSAPTAPPCNSLEGAGFLSNGNVSVHKATP